MAEESRNGAAQRPSPEALLAEALDVAAQVQLDGGAIGDVEAAGDLRVVHRLGQLIDPQADPVFERLQVHLVDLFIIRLAAQTFDQRWELDPENQDGIFRIKAYQPVYLLPVSWRRSVNVDPCSPNPVNCAPGAGAQDLHTEAKFQLSLKTKVLQDILDTLALNYTTIDATTGAQAGYFEFRPGKTPVQPTYPGSTGGLVIAGTPVAGPTNSTRFKITVPAYANYTYEVYGNPTLFNAGNGITNVSSATNNLIISGNRTNMGWGALPFSLSQIGTISTNKFTAAASGNLDLYLSAQAAKGFYFVTFRLPGANTGTP